MEPIKLEDINLEEIDMDDDLLATDTIINEDTQEFNFNLDLEDTQEIEVVNDNE